MGNQAKTIAQVSSILTTDANYTPTGFSVTLDGNTLSNIPGGNVVGTVANSNYAAFSNVANSVNGTVANANYAAFAGEVVDASQPNITSLGTLSGLTVGGVSNLSAVGNVIITGGSNGQVLTTNGSGNLSWSTVDNIGNANFAAYSNIANTANAVAGANVSGTVANANYAAFAGEVVDASQPNITSLGTLTGLTVGGVSNLTGVSNVIITGGSNGQYLQTNGSGNLSWATVDNIGNANYASFSNIANTANAVAGANVSGTVANANYAAFAGEVVDASQPNITSLGTLSGLTVSGVSNLGSNGNVIITGGSNGQVLTTNGSGNLSWGGAVANANYAAFAGEVVDASQPNITSVGTLTGLTLSGGINGTDATFSGNLTVSGNVTYANVNTVIVEDPVMQLGGGANGQPLTSNDGRDRGLYLHVFDTPANAEIDKFMGWDNSGGQFVFGSNVTMANDVVTVNNYGNVQAGYFIGNGSQLTGTVANANYAAFANVASTANSVAGANVTGTVANANYAAFSGEVVDASQPNITSLGTLTGLTVSGTSNLGANGNVIITGGTNGQVLTTNGSGNLSWTTVSGGSTDQISNGNSNVVVTANGNVTTSVAGNANILVVTGTGANIAGTLNATGNANTGNLGTGRVLATGNITAPQLISNVATGTAPLVVTSTTQVANLSAATAGSANTAGTVTTAAQPNITSVGTLTSVVVTGNANAGNLNTSGVVSATGNITGANFIGAGHINGNSNVTVVANGNVTVSSAGNANVLVVTGTGANVAGTLNATGNANTGNLGTAQVLATANITAPQLISNVATGTAPLVVTSTTQVANLSAATAGSANTAGTVTTAAQPNITSLGTLTGLTVNGVSNLTANGNVRITGGAAGQVLTTDGAGNLSWSTAGGAVSQIQNGNSNVIVTANGNVSTSVAGNTNVFVVTGLGANVAGTLTATGNVTGFNFIGAGHINGNSNVNIVPNGNVTISSAGNASIVVVTGTGANIAGTLNATGNANTGNLGTAQVLATTNITAPQLISNVATGTAPLVVTSTTQVANLSVATAGSANTAGTVTTAAQPNITSVGTLTGLTVNGTSNLRAVADVIITGGSNGQVLTTNGSGNLSWTTVSGGGGATDQISSGNSNVIVTANGNVNTSVAGNANVFVVTGTGANVAGTLNATGDAAFGSNVVVTGNLFVNGNTTYINTETMDVEDPIITLGTGANGAAPTSNANKDLGVLLNYFDTASRNAFMGFDISTGNFTLGSNVSVANEVVTFNTLGNLTLRSADVEGNLDVVGVSNLGAIGNVKITGGSNGQAVYTYGNGTLYFDEVPPNLSLQLPRVGWGLGRIHAYDNRIYMAGGGTGAVYRQVYNSGTNQAGVPLFRSYNQAIQDGGPNTWTSFSASVTNFYGVGDNGKLYTVGEGGAGGVATTGFESSNKDFMGPANAAPFNQANCNVQDVWCTQYASNPGSGGYNAQVGALVYANVGGTRQLWALGSQPANGPLGVTLVGTGPTQVTTFGGDYIKDVVMTYESGHIIHGTSAFPNDRALRGCGTNTSGQLGIGNAVTVATYQACLQTGNVTVGTTVEEVVKNHSVKNACLRKTDGTVWATGNNLGGVLGDGTTVQKNVFTQVLTAAGTPLTNIVKVRAWGEGFVFLNSSGVLYITGPNTQGIWGDGTAAGTAGNNYARQVQTSVADFWCFPDGHTTSLLRCGIWIRNTSNICYYTGNNADWQSGVLPSRSVNTILTYTAISGLRRGVEWITDMRSLGMVFSGTEGTAGAIFKTNLNNLYMCGAVSSTANVNFFNTTGTVANSTVVYVSGCYMINDYQPKV